LDPQRLITKQGDNKYLRTDLSERLLRPRFLAIVLAVYLLVGHVDAVRQRRHQREYPYGGDDLRGRPYGHPGLKRVDDDEEPVDGDRCERQRGRVHAGALGVRHDVTEYLAEHPMACRRKSDVINSFSYFVASKLIVFYSL